MQMRAKILPTRWNRILTMLVIGAWLSTIAWGCRGSSGPPSLSEESPKPVSVWEPRSHEGFVGSQACQRCHEAIYEKYQSHPMAHAMSLAGDLEAAVEHQSDSLAFSNPPFLEYEVEVKDNGILHHERVIGDDGKVLVEQTEPVAFAIGSGTRGRSYVVERDGELFMSPISWYSSDDHWDLSPGYRPANHPQFSRPVADRCLRCHCGQPAAVTSEDLEFPAYEKPIVIEAGISCERCHGPGAEHIQFHDSGKAASGQADPIVNPTQLDAIQRDDVCNQCHLQGQFEILRPGRHPGDFRPGDAIADIWTTLIDGTNVKQDQSTKAVSHVQQMQSSRCYVESDRALACVSCHDPHGMASPKERTLQVRQACLKCHSDADCSETMPVRQATASVPDNCVQCHMPRLSAHDVPHTTQTDHRLRKNPLQDSREVPTTTKPEASELPWKVYEEETHPLSELEFERALGMAIVRDATQKGDDSLYPVALERLTPLRETLHGDLAYLEALGLAYYRSGQTLDALEAWQQILGLSPDHAETLLDLGTHFEKEGKLAKANEYLSRFVKVRPHDTDGLFRLSLVKGQLLQMDDAIRLAERVVKLNPRDWTTRRWLGDLYRDSGQTDKATATQELLDKINENRLRAEAPSR